jgi:hypothetical protein
MAASEAVERRLRRVTSLLNEANVPYAVIGGNAVATWVATIDEDSTRQTKDVDLILRREDMDRARAVLESGGFVYAETMDVPMFLDGPNGKPSSAVHIIYAGEKIKADDLAPAADVTESDQGPDFQVVTLEALVRMKLTSNRDKDRMHLRDLLGVGLIDASWLGRYPPELAARLQHILDTPNG